MTVWPFRILTFLAAFLLFSVQPLTGKMILPAIGGAPQGWLVVLAFFQTTLLCGYGLIWLTTRMKPFVAGLFCAVLLGVGFFLLAPQSAFQPSRGNPSFELFIWLWETRGPALIALSAMAPLTQRLFSAASTDNPYPLYAISNAGSVLGLLSYPLFIEPLSGLAMQIQGWGVGFSLLIPVLVLCAFAARRSLQTETHITASTQDWRRILWWLALSALPASMLSGVTTLISMDIMSFPLLWVIPLALYLGSFILAFSDRRHYDLPQLAFFYGGAATIFLSFIITGTLGSVPFAAFVLLGLFAIGAFLFHRMLYEARPAPADLPRFYFILALGGALGGSFNAFIVPLLMNTANEFYWALALSLLLIPSLSLKNEGRVRLRPFFIGCFVAALLIAAGFIFLPRGLHVILQPLIFICFFPLLFAPRLLVGAFALYMVLGVPSLFLDAKILEEKRNFFSVMRVADLRDGKLRVFMHGITLHGQQPQDPDYRERPVTYYNREGPLGDVLVQPQAQRGALAVVGLGTGQTACYATADRPLTFYEIDPDVVDLARRHFTYLDACPPADIIIGDARLKLAQGESLYQGIVLDAFSSDAIPAHLLTSEAIAMYRSRVRDDGFLLFHISNKYIQLDDMLGAQADLIGWRVLAHKYTPAKDHDPYGVKSWWLVMSPNDALMDALAAKGWKQAPEGGSVWTDDRFSLLPALHLWKSLSN